MRAVVIKLKVAERKALAGAVDQIQAANEMMLRAGKILTDQRKDLWDLLNGMYPKVMYPKVMGVKATFNYEDFELSYFVPSTKQEEYKALKEKAIEDRDYEEAARWRDLEKKEMGK